MSNLLHAKEALSLLEVNSSKIRIKVREKNNTFKKIFNISDSFIKDVIFSLEVKNFVRRLENKDKKIKTKYLYEFETKLRLLDEYDFKVLVDVYIKICFIDNFTLVVSFHEKEF